MTVRYPRTGYTCLSFQLPEGVSRLPYKEGCRLRGGGRVHDRGGAGTATGRGCCSGPSRLALAIRSVRRPVERNGSASRISPDLGGRIQWYGFSSGCARSSTDVRFRRPRPRTGSPPRLAVRRCRGVRRPRLGAVPRTPFLFAGAEGRPVNIGRLAEPPVTMSRTSPTVHAKINRTDARNTAAYLDSRGYVYLRLADYDKAIADYASLASTPKNAWSRYGPGLARLRKGQTAERQADIAAAVARFPKITELTVRRDLVPCSSGGGARGRSVSRRHDPAPPAAHPVRPAGRGTRAATPRFRASRRC